MHQSSAFCFYLSRELCDHYYGEVLSVPPACFSLVGMEDIIFILTSLVEII